MFHEKALYQQRVRRAFRVRKKLKGTPERPRLTIFRSAKHIYCQLIDDSQGKTIASASTADKDLRSQLPNKNGGNCEAAKVVGTAIAQRAKAIGVGAMCIDRGPYKYHGRLAALTDAIREAGIQV